ncbi:MAG TPA: lipoyl(octanoyl) transferase LipB [Gemmata sp.]
MIDRPTQPDTAPERALTAYLLGGLDFDELSTLQRRLCYDVSGDRDTAAVVVCEPEPGITVGREGSAAHIRPNASALASRRWPVRWVARGGGALLHQPGQVACYPILPLDAFNLSPARYVAELQSVVLELCRDFGIEAVPDSDHPGVRANGRRIAHVGIAIRDWVSSYGIVINVNPDLAPFRDIRCDGDAVPMTSLQRESALRVRVSGVRQKLLELIAARFGFARVSVFHNHPAALPRPNRHALPHAS